MHKYSYWNTSGGATGFWAGKMIRNSWPSTLALGVHHRWQTLTIIIIPYRHKCMADKLQPARFMMALGRLVADNKDSTIGDRHVLLAQFGTRHLDPWTWILVSFVEKVERGRRRTCLGSLRGSRIHSPNAVVLAKESGAPVQECIINFLPVIREIKERSRGGQTLCVDAWWCGCENVSCHLSFDLWINFKFQLHPGVYFLATALDPHLRHGPRKLGCASGAGHSLPGARPLDPLEHMLHPSSGTHL